MTAARRETPPPAGGASSAAKLWRVGPYQSATGWLRGLGIGLAVGLFLALSGAFTGDDTALWRRLAYWLPMMLVGAVWGAFVARAFFPAEGLKEGPFIGLVRCVLLAALAMSLPFTGVVWLASWAALGHRIPVQNLPFLFGAVFMIALAMTVLNTLVETRHRAMLLLKAAPETPRPVKFLERLPPRLRGADIWAVEAEDHYLRLHTSKGQELILMRLADAVEELAGLEGAQVHRSWWVAREAVSDVRRGDGRATLTLVDGAQVPVSRTYARLLREAGWY